MLHFCINPFSADFKFCRFTLFPQIIFILKTQVNKRTLIFIQLCKYNHSLHISKLSVQILKFSEIIQMSTSFIVKINLKIVFLPRKNI